MGLEVSERLFQRYCEERGLDGWDEHEPSITGAPADARRRPDFRVSLKGHGAAICEVKEFRTNRISKRLAQSGTAMLSDTEVFGAVRNAIKDAAGQLKAYRSLGDPLVVVLANPHSADVSLNDPAEVIWALYGNPVIRIEVGPDARPAENSDSEISAGRDGVLSGAHSYVSAVVTLHVRDHSYDYWDAWSEENRSQWETIDDRVERGAMMLELRSKEAKLNRTPSGDYIYVRVYETEASADGRAVPLPRSLFNGERDERYAVDLASGEMRSISK